MTLDNLASTNVEPWRETAIIQRMLSDFYIASKDFNKIHQGAEGIALGYQMGGMLRELGDALVEQQRPGYRCSAHNIEFLKAIRVGSQVERYFPDATQEGDHTALKTDGENYLVKVAMRLKGQEEPRAIATLIYSPQLPHATNGEGGIEYILRARDAEGVSRGIGKQEPDYQLLVLSLASNTLAEHGRELIELADIYGHLPVYGLHQLTPHAAIQNVKEGDKIRIITNAAKSADRLVRQMKKANRVPDKAGAIVKVEAVNAKSEVLYNGRLVLVLKKPEDVLREAA